MLDPFSTNPTQFIGALSFTATTIACMMAARRPGRNARMWKGLALVNGLFFLEICIGLRHRIGNFAETLLRVDGLYAKMHGGIQEIIDVAIVIAGLILAALFLSWRQVSDGAARVAASITIAVLTLFAIETVSLHALDAIFYRHIGPVLMIGWLWAIAAAGISFAALWCLRTE
jgi:uncharacterized membrane protein